MVFQECSPCLGWWRGKAARHQVGNRSFGDLDSQLEQLAMNSGRTPERIGRCHLKNKVTDLRADRRPPGSLLPGLKSPEQLETLSMPPNDSFGFDDDQSLSPVAPESIKQNPEKTVFYSNLRPFPRTLQDGQLLAEGKVFQSQIGILFGSQKYVQNQFQKDFHHGLRADRSVLKCQ